VKVTPYRLKIDGEVVWPAAEDPFPAGFSL